MLCPSGTTCRRSAGALVGSPEGPLYDVQVSAEGTREAMRRGTGLWREAVDVNAWLARHVGPDREDETYHAGIGAAR